MQHLKPYNRLPTEISCESVSEAYQLTALQIGSVMWQKMISAPVSRRYYDAIIFWGQGLEKENSFII